MRVLMFGWEFPPEYSGGLGVACYGLVRALVQEGVQVSFVLPRKMPVLNVGADIVFASNRPPRSPEEARALASGYVREEDIKNLREKFPDRYGTSLFDEVLRYAHDAVNVAHAYKGKVDVIHAHDWLCYPAALTAKRILGVPLVVHVHATEYDRTGFGALNERIAAVERWGVHEADQVVTVSEYTKQVVTNRYSVLPEKIEVVHNGIDHDDGAILKTTEATMARVREEGWRVVLFMGRLTVQKGPDYFIETAKRVLSKRPKTLFVVCGSGDMMEHMIHHASYLGIGDKVIFTGFLRNEARARLFALADLLVMPSVSEPFGIVPLEALLNGTPVIISKQSGVAEVIKNALKADFWDTEDMAHKILSVLAYPVLHEALRVHGEREARGQVWQRAARRCVSVYKKLIHLFTRKKEVVT